MGTNPTVFTAKTLPGNITKAVYGPSCMSYFAGETETITEVLGLYSYLLIHKTICVPLHAYNCSSFGGR